MTTPMGKLTGTGIVRGQDGQIKGEFTLTAECTPEQAEAIARDILVNLEENDNGNHSR